MSAFLTGSFHGLEGLLMSASRPTGDDGSAPPPEMKGIPIDHYRLLHSTAHVMAAAVRRLWPDVKLTVGPPISKPFRGFYYDIDLEHRIAPEDLPKIEAEMAKIVKEDSPFERKVMPKEEALRFFRSQHQDYKLELIEAKAGASAEAASEGVEGDVVTTYSVADFTDLCRGPHVDRAARCRHFKLLHAS